MPFLDVLHADEIEGRDGYWKLHEPLVYLDGMRRFEIQIEFETDLGSQPWWIRWFLPRDGKGRRAYVLHDWLYRTGLVSRWEADAIMYRAMLELGCSMAQARTAWLGVRVGGRSAWDNYRRMDVV